MPTTRGKRSTFALTERVVLAAFTDASGHTRAELGQRTGLSRAAVSAAVGNLMASGDLVPADASGSGPSRGRPSARYRRADLLAPVVLVELLHSAATKVSVIDAYGVTAGPLEAAAWSSTWTEWADTTHSAAAALLGGRSPRGSVLLAPFPVREGTGQPAVHAVERERHPGRLPPNPAWLETDPRPALAALLGCPPLVLNDANAAALGEALFGAGRGYRAVVHVSVRDGVGAGLVFDGELFTGASGFAGELAHAQVTEPGRFCFCGGRGCLATETGGPGLARPLEQLYERPVSFDEVTDDIARGDPWVTRYFRDLGALIGKPLSSVVTILDPDCVVLDARLEAAAAPLIAGLIATLEQRCPAALVSRLRVLPGALPDAAARGALAAANAAQRQDRPGLPGAPPLRIPSQ